MNFFPSKVESLHLALSIDELMGRFSNMVKSGDGNSEKRVLFDGAWTHDKFSITQLLKIPNRYTPIINGKITASENGLLVKMNFSLSQITKRRLVIYTIVPLTVTAFFILGYNAWLYGSISFGLSAVNYILAREHFTAQVNKSRHALKRLFSTE